MPGLSRDLVEHQLPIKAGFRPYKQPTRCFNPVMYDGIKEEINHLLIAGFIRSCHYAEWISNIVLVEKNDSGKIRVSIDFRDLNKVTSKTAFRCPGFVGLFEWIVMTFGLKNGGATYQRAMNLIFRDLLGIILEVYIDDIVIKSAGLSHHLADLRLALERMRQYGLKMNPLKCAFGVSAGKFLGFIIHEKGIEIDPKRIEVMKKVEAPACKKNLQKFLGKVNYLRRFISNLSGKIDDFTPILRLKDEAEFTWGAEQQEAFEKIKKYLSSPPVLKAPKRGIPFRLYVAAEDKVIGVVLT